MSTRTRKTAAEYDADTAKLDAELRAAKQPAAGTTINLFEGTISVDVDANYAIDVGCHEVENYQQALQEAMEMAAEHLRDKFNLDLFTVTVEY